MRDLMQCSGCLAALAFAILTPQIVEATASIGDSEYRVHWVEKNHILQQHVRRKDICQNDGWSLCPPSVGGGCCPDNFECGTASCFATTAGPTSACGSIGYYACPASAGPGACCPVGFICDTDGNDCDPPPGSSVTCPASYIGCAASLGGGCCPEGRVCGSGLCYDGTPSTATISEKITITSKGHVITTIITTTTVITDGPPSTSSGSATAAGVPQLIPSTVAKQPAIHTSDSSGGHDGLSSGALGGIIAAVVVVLLAIISAAAFVILRLKKTEKAAKAAEAAAIESRHETSTGGGGPRGRKPGFGQPSVSEVDATTDDIDPFTQIPIMRPSPEPRSRSASSFAADRSPSRTPNFSHSDTSSPPLWSTPFNYVPSSNESDGRQSSLDNYSQSQHHDAVPINTAAARRSAAQFSVDSGGVSYFAHSRQPSDTSELEAPHGTSELDPQQQDGELRRRSSSVTRPAKAHVRRNSDLSSPGLRGRGDSNAAAAAAAAAPSPNLGTVSEIFELHGYYGPVQGSKRDS